MEVDLIIGPIAIAWANAMLGEVTPKMAEAVASSPALKIFLPIFQENVEILNVQKDPPPHLVDEVTEKLKEVMKNVRSQCVSGKGRA